MNLEDRLDLFPLFWEQDGLTARLPKELGIPDYKIVKVFNGYRVTRAEGEQSEKKASVDECKAFIRRDSRRAILRLASHRDPSFWIPMFLAPRRGWGILAQIRSDIAEFVNDPKFKAWANQQIVIHHSPDEPDETDIWDMAAPAGASGIPGEWFTGWRPLAVPLLPADPAVIDDTAEDSEDASGLCEKQQLSLIAAE